MTRIVLAFSALLAVLVLPFVARSRRPVDRASDQAAERLVIITPHNEPVLIEFGHGFREHMAREGRRIEIDWRRPGGTAEISRFLISEYTASFRRHWTQDVGRPWSAKVARQLPTHRPSLSHSTCPPRVCGMPWGPNSSG